MNHPRPEWHPLLNWGKVGVERGGQFLLHLTNPMIRKHLVHCLREVHRCRTFPLPVGPRLAELALEQVLTLATSLSKGGDMLDERKRPTVDLIPSLIPA